MITKYLLERLSERSTWLGLTGLLTALGVTLSPELATATVSAGLAIAGFITAMTKDTK